MQAQHFELEALKRNAAADAAAHAQSEAKEAERAKAQRERRKRAERQHADREGRQPAPAGSPRDIARALVSASQWPCLDKLWTRESGWRVSAVNPSSGAYGIPQALPGSKMRSAGADWRTNPRTQIRWGLGYIRARYGNACGAWAHSQSVGWY